MTRIDNYIDLIGFLNELNCGEFEIEFVDMLKNKAAKKGLNLWHLSIREAKGGEIQPFHKADDLFMFDLRNAEFSVTTINATSLNNIRDWVAKEAREFILWQRI